jgi:diacylglycerol kinase (ATP)
VRITLIHNPGAGAQQGDAKALMALLEEEGHDVRAKSSKDKDWKSALDAPADLVAVAGGDGTVGRVAREMLGRGVPVAPLPAGTANNISRSLGLVDRHWEELVRAWPEGRRVKLDVGMARGPWGERAFVEGVGAGLFACLLSDSEANGKPVLPKRPEDRVSQALERLKKEAAGCAAVEIAASLDGEDVSGRYLLFEALNIPNIGPNLFLAPDSKPGDGTFDLVMVGEEDRDRLTGYLKAWQENRERLAVLPSRRGKVLRIEWRGYPLHIDDELWPEEGARVPERATIELAIEGAVEFVAPDAKRK